MCLDGNESVCVCCSLCVFVWHYKRIKACYSRGCRLDHFWSFPLYVRLADEVLTCHCVVICVSVRLCEHASPKTATFLSLFQAARNPPPSLPPSFPPSLPPSIHPTPAWKTSPVISSCGICCYFTDSFSTLYLALTCTFFWSLANGVVPENSSRPSVQTQSTPATKWLLRLGCTRADNWSQSFLPVMVKMLLERVFSPRKQLWRKHCILHPNSHILDAAIYLF